MEQTRNDNRFLLKISWKISRSNTHRTSWKQLKYIGILTNPENQMEQPELHPGHLIFVPITINCFLVKNKQYSSVTVPKTDKIAWSILYHETVAVGFASCQVGHNEGPYASSVCYYFYQRRHWEVPVHKSLPQSMSGLHPTSVLSAYQPDYNELRH